MATKKNVTVDKATESKVKAASKTTVKKESKTTTKTTATTAKKDTKESLTQYLNDNISVIKTDKDLYERVAYVGKMWKKDQSKVDITTLRSLKKETEQLVLQTQAAASLKKPEDEAKPKKTLKRKVSSAKTEAEPVQQTEEESKPNGKKQTAPKSEDSATEETKAEPKKPKKSKVVESHVEGREEVVDRFADEYQTEIGTFTKVSDIQSYKDLAEAVSEGRDIYLMWYISKRVAKTIDYVGGLTLRSLDELSKSWFENDLDISRVVFISEGEESIVVAVSEYTDAPFMVNKDEIAYDKKDGVRYSGRLTYEIYELTEEAEAE